MDTKEKIIELQAILGSREAVAVALGISRWTLENWTIKPPAWGDKSVDLLWQIKKFFSSPGKGSNG